MNSSTVLFASWYSYRPLHQQISCTRLEKNKFTPQRISPGSSQVVLFILICFQHTYIYDLHGSFPGQLFNCAASIALLQFASRTGDFLNFSDNVPLANDLSPHFNLNINFSRYTEFLLAFLGLNTQLTFLSSAGSHSPGYILSSRKESIFTQT